MSKMLRTPEILASSAEFSPDGVYRYTLDRLWGDGPTVLFLMLNPSTADAVEPDPTVTRCIDFAHRLGFGSLTVCNLFAFRATLPKDMAEARKRGVDIVGPLNDQRIVLRSAAASMVIAAWGTHGGDLTLRRGDRVARMLNRSIHVLQLTKSGQPHHPLYLPATCVPLVWRSKG